MGKVRFIVTKFGVDRNGNDTSEPIWNGIAESKPDAISKCLCEKYDEKDREFMRYYLEAHYFLLWKKN